MRNEFIIAYERISFIQHRSFEIVCNLKLLCEVDLTLELASKALRYCNALLALAFSNLIILKICHMSVHIA